MADQLIKMYGITPTDATALAWGGLENEAGSLYSNLSQAEKNNIEITNASYKNGTNGTPCNQYKNRIQDRLITKFDEFLYIVKRTNHRRN